MCDKQPLQQKRFTIVGSSNQSSSNKLPILSNNHSHNNYHPYIQSTSSSQHYHQHSTLNALNPSASAPFSVNNGGQRSLYRNSAPISGTISKINVDQNNNANSSGSQLLEHLTSNINLTSSSTPSLMSSSTSFSTSFSTPSSTPSSTSFSTRSSTPCLTSCSTPSTTSSSSLVIPGISGITSSTAPSSTTLSNNNQNNASNKRIFSKELRCMMYGFGDDQNPYTESVDMVEDLVLQFISDIAIKALNSGTDDKIAVEDLFFILRKDPKKYARLKDLLEMNHELRQARKAFDEIKYLGP